MNIYFLDNENIPIELVTNICSRLSIPSLLALEAVNQKIYMVTQPTWQLLKEKEEVTYDWYHLKSSSQKLCYHFNIWIKKNLLHEIISHVFVQGDLKKAHNTLFDSRLPKLFTRLAACRTILERKKTEDKIPFYRAEADIKAIPKQRAEGGDLLIKGLFAILSESSLARTFLQMAIQKTMTWASFLQLITSRGPEDYSVQLALEAAKKGDYSGLQLLCQIAPNHLTTLEAPTNNSQAFSALVAIANGKIALNSFGKTPDRASAGRYYQEAINLLTIHNIPIPRYILEQAAALQKELGDYDKANQNYKLIQNVPKDQASCPLFLTAFTEISSFNNALDMATRVQDWKEADKNLAWLIPHYKSDKAWFHNETLFTMLPQAAFAKENLQDFEGACKHYYDYIYLCRSMRNGTVPVNIISGTIACLEQLQKWPEAYKLCSEQINFYNGQSYYQMPPYLIGKEQALKIHCEIAEYLPSHPELLFFVQNPSLCTLYKEALKNVELSIKWNLLLEAEALYKELQDWNKVDLVYRHLFHVCQEHAPSTKVPLEIFMQAAYVKEKLESPEEAKIIYHAILSRTEKPEPLAAYKLGLLEKNLQNLVGADTFFSQAISLYEKQDVPHFILNDAAFVKEQLKQWLPADVIYTQIIDDLGENVDPEILSRAAFVKMQLGQLEKADDLYTEAIKVSYERGLPSINLLEDAARIKEKLQKWEEADALYAQIITECRELTPSTILIKAGLVKSKLNQVDDALNFLRLAINALTIS